MNDELVLEKICNRQLELLDRLTFSQRLIVQQMLMLVKNGHTHKFTYKFFFKKADDMKRRFAERGLKDYTLKQFMLDIQALAEKKVRFIDDAGRPREFTWLINLDIDNKARLARYNFCKDLSKTCLTYEGKKFVLQLLDFVALENRSAKRLFRFLSGCSSRTVTTHRVKALLKYFFISEDMDSDSFLQVVIKPAVKELNQRNIFTFKNISAKVLLKDDEEFVEIIFFSVFDRNLPCGCKIRK